MNKFYSASAQLFSSANEVSAVLNSFGFHKGRYLAAVPKSFVRELFEATAHLPEVEKKRVRKLIERNRPAILNLGLAYDRNKDWLENCLNFVRANKIDGILFNEQVDGKKVFSIEHVIDGDLPSSDGLKDYATAKNLVAYMSPVLKSSKEVYLIDPYFSLGKRNYVSFLEELVAHPDSKDVHFVIFAKAEHFITKEQTHELAKRHLSKAVIEGCSVSFYPLENMEDMHGRYVFTIHGGATYDKGFQVASQTLVDFSVMPAGLHQDYFDEYNGLLRTIAAHYTFRSR